MFKLAKLVKLLSAITLLSLLNACSLTSSSTHRDGPPLRPINVSKIPDAKPRPLPRSRYGNPSSYAVFGRRYYVLHTAKGYHERGIASWYGRKFQGKLTSSREPYNLYAMTAASPVLPIPSFVRVTNLENGRSIVVKVNDRGPFMPNRIIDLSYVAAKKLGYVDKGTAMVEVTAIDASNPTEKTTFAQISKKPHLYLQIGAFANYNNAIQLKAEIANITKRNIRISSGIYHSQQIYRVQIGPLIGVGESDKLLLELKRRGLGHAFTIIS